MFEMPRIKNASLSLLVLMHQLVGPTTASADSLFDDASAVAVAGALSSGRCQAPCQVGDWQIVALVAPPAPSGGESSGGAHYLARSVSELCGSRGCAEAYFVHGPDGLRVIEEGYDLSAQRRFEIAQADAEIGSAVPAGAAGSDTRGGYDLRPFLTQLSALNLGSAAVEEAVIAAVELSVDLAVHAESPRLFLDAFGLNGAVLVNAVLRDPARAAELAALRIGEGIATDVAVSVAAELVSAFVATTAISDPAWQPVVQAALRAAVHEFGLLAVEAGPQGGFGVTSPVSGLFRRAREVREIYLAARGLADDRASALVALAGSIDSAALLLATVPGPRASAIARDTLDLAMRNVPRIVGQGDAPAIQELVQLSFMGLTALHRGDRQRALSMLGRMYEAAQVGTANRPLVARLDPRNWIPALVTLDYRSPAERAVQIFVAATALRDLTEAPVVTGGPTDGPLPPPSEGALALGRELLAAYGGDRARMRLVADHADHALLALAAYGEAADLRAAERRGWRPVPGFEAIRRASGDAGGEVHATLFRSDGGQLVLAFRGTVGARDWVSNIAGTAGIPFTTGQIRAATLLARQIQASYPEVEFVGHSLGGRLAQVARLVTGRPAVVFNSAPLGVVDPAHVLAADATTMIRTLLARNDDAVALHRFRGPADALTLAFPPGDTEVSNVITTQALTGWAARIPGFNTVAQAVYLLETQRRHDHRMEPLAAAMQLVRVAQEMGWIEAQPAAAPVEPPARSGRWGPGIVLGEGVFQALWRDWPCRHEDWTRCLAESGASDEAVAFARQFGDGWATDFRELGRVDLVEVWSPFRAHTNGYEVLVSEDGSIHGVPFPRELVYNFDRRELDRASQRVLARSPVFAVHSIQAIAHRVLPGTRQRFVFAALLTAGSRAGAPFAVAYFLMDVNGTPFEVPTRFLGVYALDDPPADAEFIARLLREPAEVQGALNSRGYVAGPIDGVFGQRSQAALAEFQRDHCLPDTGRIDPTTAERLANADRFAPAPCAGQSPARAGILPMSPGLYATDHSLCTEDSVVLAEHLDRVLFERIAIDEHGDMAFYEAVCSSDNATFRDGTLTVTTSCSAEGNPPVRSTMRFYNVGQNSFSQPNGRGEDLVFVRCDVPEADVTVAGLRPGLYATDRRYCRGGVNYARERHVYGSYVVFGWETGCAIDRQRQTGEGTEYFALCREGVEAVTGSWLWQIEGPESFVEVRSLFAEVDEFRNGLRFTRCAGE